MRQPFPTYLQMRAIVPPMAWHVVRAFTVAGAALLVVVLLVDESDGLFVLWNVVVPSLPLVWFLAPGLWRNSCPLAAVNQFPRLFGFSRGRTLPARWREPTFFVGLVMFFVVAINRPVVFNDNGWATALVVIGLFGVAFTGGVVFKGKSGWCSTICPLLPVQRLYGQVPVIAIPNSHCQPCVGCAKNCYDFNPYAAYLADLNDDDPRYVSARRLFASLFPGFVLAFFTAPDPDNGLLTYYGYFAAFALGSVGLFYLLSTVVRASDHLFTSFYALGAINGFYWYAFPVLIAAANRIPLVGVPSETRWALSAALLAVSVSWFWRSRRREQIYIEEQSGSGGLTVGSAAALKRRYAALDAGVEVTVQPIGARIVAEMGRSLLEIAERNDFPLEAGCRMGVCGADPVAILAGMENLTPVGADERSTLERLGFAANTRLACAARLKGTCTIALTPEKSAAKTAEELAGTFDPEVRTVVVIGNGIAGVTAADYVRRTHPDCEVHLISKEKHHLYNRMGISRLVYGRSAMQGLYLLPDSWYEEQRVTTWLNTNVDAIDRAGKRLLLATGETLPYDRLILAMGSRSNVPVIERFGLPGSFVMREADDAMELRAYIQRTRCQYAVVAGGGLLGIEAAYALHKVGVHVTVLERSSSLLRRQLDRRGGELLHSYLEKLGLSILYEAEAIELRGEGQVEEVVLKDGRILMTNIFLAAAGIRPNAELASAADIKVADGIVVNERMESSDPDIYAVGDLAEFQGQVLGLWPVAVEQAKVAATNAVGTHRSTARYDGIVPVTMLKVVGVDLTSIGRIDPLDGEEAIALEDPREGRYRKLVISGGRVAGAILMGYPMIAARVTTLAREGVDISEHLEALRVGDWSILESSEG